MLTCLPTVCGLLFLLAAFVLPVRSATLCESPWAPPQTLVTPLRTAGPQGNPATVVVQGEPTVLYLSTDGRVSLRQGDRLQSLDDEASRPGGGHFRLVYDQRYLYALWWDKLRQGKRLFLRASADGGQTFTPLKIVNTGGGVLPDFDVAADGAGGVAVAFVDERDPGYQIYVNRSRDGGQTWLPVDIRLDTAPALSDLPKSQHDEAIPPANSPNDEEIPPAPPANPETFALSPKLAFHRNGLLAVWQQQGVLDEQPVMRWMARVSQDGGQNWFPDVEIHHEVKQKPTGLTLLSHGDQAYVFSFLPNQGLLAFRSTDGGLSWTSLGALPGSATAETITWIKAVASGDNVLVSYTLQQPGRKDQVHVATLAAATGEWRPQTWRLDRKEHELTKAGFADLAALPGGGVVAVWEDWRNILSAIYLDYSADSGNTWLNAPRALTEPGLNIADTPRVVTGDNQVLVTYHRGGAGKEASPPALVYQRLSYGLSVPTAAPPGPLLSPEEKAQRLKQRAEELWTLRTQGKFDETWDYFDPVYRFRTDRRNWLAGQGRMTFLEFTLGEPTVRGGLFGQIPVKIKTTMPQQKLGGIIQDPPPPEEVEFVTQWGWFYDDWYLVPPTVFGKGYLHY